MQREDVLGEALKLLELQGIANTTLEMVAERVDYPLDELRRFWPDKEAILYDALRYLSQQIDVWRRQLMLDETQTAEQKLLARYQALSECVKNNRYPGCLFIAACTFYPDPGHPIHQLADQQKSAAYDFTHELLTTLEVDDPAMVAKQMELVLEGCLSRMLVNRSQADVDTAHRLAEDILRFARCGRSEGQRRTVVVDCPDLLGLARAWIVPPRRDTFASQHVAAYGECASDRGIYHCPRPVGVHRRDETVASGTRYGRRNLGGDDEIGCGYAREVGSRLDEASQVYDLSRCRLVDGLLPRHEWTVYGAAADARVVHLPYRVVAVGYSG